MRVQRRRRAFYPVATATRKGPKGPHAQSRKDGKGPSDLGWFEGLTVRVRVKLTSKLQTD